MAELRPYEPTWRDRLANVLMGDGRSSARQQFVEGLLGSRGLGQTGMGLVDVTPFGVPLAVQESRQSFEQGNPVSGLLGAMAVLPAAKPAALAAKTAAKELSRTLPPIENSRLTQIATTGGSYEKAARKLAEEGVSGKVIDYGAGRGHGAQAIKADSFEPYPQGWSPTYTNPSDIPDSSYSGLVNLNVLNVLPPDVREQVVREMGRVLEPQGVGIISTRGRDVMSAKGVPGPEPMSLVIGEGDRARYQKGFTPQELRDFVSNTLGPRFEVSPTNIGQASVILRRLYGLPLAGAGAYGILANETGDAVPGEM